MTREQMKGLNTGDLIRSNFRHQGRTFIVTANYGSHITAVDTVDVTNETEWTLVAKASHDFGNAPPAAGQE